MIRIAPSLICSNLAKLGEEITALDKAGADYFHLDIMDGNFVPDITFGSCFVKAIRPYTSKPFEVHLITDLKEQSISNFALAGADIIIIQPENNNIEFFLTFIKSLRIKAGIALNPNTDLSIMKSVFHKVDVILVMTSLPGIEKHEFLETQIKKIYVLKQYIIEKELSVDIVVDGAIDQTNAKYVIEAGADILVSGRYIFGGGSDNYLYNIQSLRNL